MLLGFSRQGARSAGAPPFAWREAWAGHVRRKTAVFDSIRIGLIPIVRDMRRSLFFPGRPQLKTHTLSGASLR